MDKNSSFNRQQKNLKNNLEKKLASRKTTQQKYYQAIEKLSNDKSKMVLTHSEVRKEIKELKHKTELAKNDIIAIKLKLATLNEAQASECNLPRIKGRSFSHQGNVHMSELKTLNFIGPAITLRASMPVKTHNFMNDMKRLKFEVAETKSQINKKIELNQEHKILKDDFENKLASRMNTQHKLFQAIEKLSNDRVQLNLTEVQFKKEIEELRHNKKLAENDMKAINFKLKALNKAKISEYKLPAIVVSYQGKDNKLDSNILSNSRWPAFT